MATKIEWTNQTWNPVIGCTKISEGCMNCYAEKFAYRLYCMYIKQKNPYHNNLDYLWVIENSKWNGNTKLRESQLTKPFHWKKPRMIFVCSMGDLFHESVPFAWIDKVITIIALNPQHVFQILTKRPERMKEYFKSRDNDKSDIWDYIKDISYDYVHLLDQNKMPKNWLIDKYIDEDGLKDWELLWEGNWPLENLWLGITAENQEMADKRIPILLQIPAKVHFVSFEPLLSNINLLQACQIKFINWIKNNVTQYGLEWVICGPETGQDKRPMLKRWIELLYQQCKEANVPFFDKQNILCKNIKEFPL